MELINWGFASTVHFRPIGLGAEMILAKIVEEMLLLHFFGKKNKVYRLSFLRF